MFSHVMTFYFYLVLILLLSHISIHLHVCNLLFLLSCLSVDFTKYIITILQYITTSFFLIIQCILLNFIKVIVNGDVDEYKKFCTNYYETT